jgi:lipopolysaccharide/colanic/teichoic acid biosynthesis glycosyltransferase
MRAHLPSSRAYFRLRFSIFDTFWAALSPLLALYLRDAFILSKDGATQAILYCLISFAFSMIAILAFRLNDGISRYFSVSDAINVVKAVCTAAFMTALFLFTFTRLQGIPRSTPVIHALILASGLITVRALALLRDDAINIQPSAYHPTLEHIILIGANDLSAFYIKFIRAYSPIYYRVVAVLDDELSLLGRTLVGVPVVAAVHNIERTIDEFQVHGVKMDRIVIGGDEALLSKEALAEVRRVSTQREIPLTFVPELIGLAKIEPRQPNDGLDLSKHRKRIPALAGYHKTKRLIDFFVSAAAILILSPLIALTSVLILFDVGSPVIFWQQRIGQSGSAFFLYKFRTLRAPFDSSGQPVSDAQRLSWVGRLLRETRLDELPQLFNVLVGDMSLIGPRPLLPRDQPANSMLRLAARPGITGWAQVNGGNLVTTDEKGALDDWYVRNASPWVDLRTIGLTFLFLFRGERRSEPALSEALVEHQKATEPRHHSTQSRRNVREVIGVSLVRTAALKVRSGKNPRQINQPPAKSDRNKDV